MYFQFANRYQPGTKARAEKVNADFDRVAAAFAAVEGDLATALANAAAASSGVGAAVAAANNATASAAAAGQAAAAAYTVAQQALAAARVTSFNGRTGNVALTSGDVTTALGFTPANRAGDTFTGDVIFSSAIAITGSGGLSTTGLAVASPGAAPISFRDTSAPAGNRLWDIISSGGSFVFRALNDAYTSGVAAVSFTRAGQAISLINLFAPTAVHGSLAATSRLYGRADGEGTPGYGLGRIFAVTSGGPPADAVDGDLTFVVSG